MLRVIKADRIHIMYLFTKVQYVIANKNPSQEQPEILYIPCYARLEDMVTYNFVH